MEFRADHAQLETLALEAPAFLCFIDINSPEFAAPGNMPQRVRNFCARTNLYVPRSTGKIMRCIYESLALEYLRTLEQVKD